MVWNHGLSRAVLRVYTRVLLDEYRRGARARGIGGQTGMVTALQRAGGALCTGRSPSMFWRVFHCGGRLRLIAILHDPVIIRKILAHLALAHSGQSPGPTSPAPSAAAP